MTSTMNHASHAHKCISMICICLQHIQGKSMVCIMFKNEIKTHEPRVSSLMKMPNHDYKSHGSPLATKMKLPERKEEKN